MQYVWMTIDRKGTVQSTALITLEKGGDVFWDDHEDVKGHWHNDFQEDGISFMTIEFAASFKVPWRRHLMVQVDDGKFRLLDKQDPHYDDKKLWTQKSVTHMNRKVVAMISVNGKDFMGGLQHVRFLAQATAKAKAKAIKGKAKGNKKTLGNGKGKEKGKIGERKEKGRFLRHC